MNASEPRSSFARGGSAVLFGQLLYICVTLLSVVVLSRLLTPADFGLIAMVGVLLAFGEQLRDLGISTSALRASVLSDAQASNLFWVAVGLSAFVATALAFGAPLVAGVYNEPRLVHVVPLLAVTILLNGMQSQFQVQIARNHQYAALAYVNVVANVVGVGIAITGALVGWGYWALVAQSVAFSLAGLILRIYAAKWRPRRFLRLAGTRHLLGDGLNYSASSLVNYASRNADVFMLGVRSSAAEVGLYSRANQFVSLISSLVASLTNVAVPALNADRKRLADVTRSAVNIQSMVGFALAFVLTSLAVSAGTFIPIALGPGWEGSVVLLKILCLGGLGYGLFYVNYWVFLVMLPSRIMLAYSLVGQLLAIGLIVWGSFQSPAGTAMGVAGGQLVLWMSGFLWLRRYSEIRSVALLANGLRVLLTALLTFATASWLLAIIPHGGGFVALAVEVLCVGLVFVALIAITGRGRAELGQGLRAARAAWAKRER